MEIVLNRRRLGAYGQDFLFSDGIERLGLRRVDHQAKRGYVVDNIDGLRLVVTHNPEDETDAKFVSGLPESVAVVAHLHLQLPYLTVSQRSALDRTVSRANALVLPARFLLCNASREFPKTRCELIRYGFDTDRFRPSSAADRAACREQFSAGRPTTAIICVGRLECAKGLQLLRYIAPRVGDGAELWIQFLANARTRQTNGYHAIAEALVESNPNNVRAIPDVDPRSDRPVRYADWLLSPSLMEVSPMVVLEALLCGVPALATRSTPLFDELVTELGIDSQWLRVVNIPDEVQRRTPRKNLKLNVEEVEAIGKQILDLAARLRPVCDEDRNAIRSRALAAGLDKKRMIAECRALYDEVEKSRSA